MNKRVLIISIIVGLLIAIITRASLIVFSPDFEYYRIGNIYHPSELIPLEQQEFLDKPVVGMSGFPFQTYADCKIGPHGMNMMPRCGSSFLNEFAIILNTLFWTLIIYGVVIFIKKFVKPALKKKE